MAAASLLKLDESRDSGSDDESLLEITPFAGNADSANEIRTSKYTVLTFLPYNLWEQFHSLPNIYFLVLMFMQAIPAISITLGKPTIAMPLCAVIAFTALKDLWEDQKRKEADNRENTLPTQKVRNSFEASAPEPLGKDIAWCEVKQGDVLLIREGQMMPADMVLLRSSESEQTCSVETMNLDGETNLKQKVCGLPPGCALDDLTRLKLHAELPRAELYEFNGAFVDGSHESGIGMPNLLLRGSSLQQTKWVLGLVVYCGHDTRVMQNSQGAQFKQSALDVEMNRVIILVFIFELLLAMTGGIFYVLWEKDADELWYLMPQRLDGQFLSFLSKAGTWVLQLGNMVPISLLVTMTTVKLMQGKLITEDETMCYEPLGNKKAEVHTSQVLESLGQVTHVFSDKTGTLTCNEMLYKACSVAGKVYGLSNSNSLKGDPHVDFSGAKQLLEDINLRPTDEAGQTAAHFLLCHALCHSVTTAESTDPLRPEYRASSPDELALVSAARELGLAFVTSTMANGASSSRLRVAEPLTRAVTAATGAVGSLLTIEVLDLCDFDNDRKRMSVIVRYTNKRIVLLVKGADTTMLPLIDASSDKQKMEKQRIVEHLHQFATKGLRTLCLAYREVPEAEFSTWHREYRAASASISKSRSENVRTLAGGLEESKPLTLLGATAIEDRLQDGVPETIEKLRSAGICVWVLTGDKLETAINIGKSCRLLTQHMENVEVVGSSDEIRQIIVKALDTHSAAEERAVTITGAALGVVLADNVLRHDFYKLASSCRSVICCRVSPKQKADVVNMCKEFHEELKQEKPVTLAIGDGANDVTMITSAHVGVGLFGKEGAQAARSADFAFGQFRYLERLLFVHGRESNRRNSIVVSYNFYKNMILVLPPYFWGPFMCFSGQPFYEPIIYQLYNVTFTFFPVLAYALFDRPCDDLKRLQECPDLYILGRQKAYFNPCVFAQWMVVAIIQAALLTLIAFSTLGNRSLDDGKVWGDMWAVGTVVYGWAVFGVNLTLALRQRLTAPITMLVILLSVLAFPVCLVIYEAFGSKILLGTTSLLFGQGALPFVLATFLVIGAFLLAEPLLWRAEQRCEDLLGDRTIDVSDESSAEESSEDRSAISVSVRTEEEPLLSKPSMCPTFGL